MCVCVLERERETERQLYFFTPSQIDEVEFARKFLFSLRVFLLDVDEEDAVTSGAVFVHV